MSEVRSPDPLVEKLRSVAEQAAAQERQEAERQEHEARLDAERILDALPAIAMAAASGGRFEVSLMEVRYTGAPQWVLGQGFTVTPGQLTGASVYVYEACVARGFSPQLRCYWQRVRRRVSRIVCQLVIRWDEPAAGG